MLKYYHKQYFKFLLIFLLWLPQVALGQEYLFDIQHISLKDGLPNRQVLHLQQDTFGNIWGSSLGIIFKYDGYTFQTFSQETLEITGNRYPVFALDQEGFVWYQHNKPNPDSSNINIINPFTDEIVSMETFLASKNIDFDFDGGGMLPLPNEKEGVYLINRKGKHYVYKNNSFKLVYKFNEKQQISQLYSDINQINYFYVQDTLFSVLPNGTIEKQIVPETLASIKRFNGVVYLCYLPNTAVPVCSWFEIKNKKVVPLKLPKKVWERDGVQDFVVDALGYKWIIVGYRGDTEKIICISPKGEIIYEQPITVGDKTADLRHLFVDKQQNLWITSTEGIYKITRRKIPFKKYIGGNGTRGIIRLGNELIVAHGSGEKSIHLTTQQVTKDNPYAITQAVYLQEDDILWTGSYYNFITRKNLKTQEERLIFDKSDEANSMFVPFRPKGSKKLWIGKLHGLAFLEENSDSIQAFQTKDKKLNNTTIRQAYENEQGTWLVTENGLFVIDKDANILQKHNKKTGLPTNEFNYLYEDEAGVFWLGSKRKGLIRWNPKTEETKVFSREAGFLNQNIYAVYEDDYGYLWLPSDYGLIRFNKETYDLTTYLPEHGIPHEEFNTFSNYQDTAGNLYFGGLNGIMTFHPKDFIKETAIDVPLYLKSFQVLPKTEDKMLDLTDEVHNEGKLIIRPSYKLFEVHFTLMDFKSKGDQLYAYKIEGYDQDWNYTTLNHIRINTLPYGHYKLKIKGQVDGIAWSDNQLLFDLAVLRPFYLQTWFILLSLVTLGLGFWQFARYRTAKLQRDKEILENTVKERTAVINEQAEALKELDKAKTNFFSNITHEFRTPLTLIIGPVEQMVEEVSSSFLKKRLQNVGKNAQHLLNLINQLLDISKLEGGQMQVEVNHGDIIAYTQSLFYQLKPLANQKAQTMRFFTNETIWKTHFDEKKWRKITFNLLSNAIKYTPKGGTIQLSLAQFVVADQEMIHLAIQDNGIGIKAKEQKNLFNRFYQIDGSTTRVQEGTGIGLSLVKELVELQGGTIEVSSQVGKGTTFEVQLPVLKMTNIPVTSIESSLEEALVLPNISPVEVLPTTVSTDAEQLDLLIIEDNTEMRAYISSCLDTSKYNIIEAANGEEGIEKALATIPDLIISDVMMPKKDGFEVIEAIRNDIRTSHIPLILLTAKTALESRLKGFERGADAYLTKPFSPKELALRIRKLIEIREGLQQRYQNGNHQSDTSNTSFEREDKFITKLKTYIAKNLTEPDLKSDKIGQYFGLSRTSLYRKLKALTNQSITEFVRTQRLAKAVELLKTGEFTVSEVAYNTGFSSPSHFARAFKKQYGKAPSEMQ